MNTPPTLRQLLCAAAVAALSLSAAAQSPAQSPGAAEVSGGSQYGTIRPVPQSGEHWERRQLTDALSRAYRAENFDELERMYNEAVTSQQRFPSGVSRAYWMVRLLGEALTPPPEAYVADRAAARQARHAHWTRMEEIGQRWATAFPKSSAAAVFQSAVLISHGFVFRGGGYASSVGAADMSAFRGYVDRARQVLEARAAEGARDPGWHTQMLEVARLQGGASTKRYAAILKNALAASPYFYDIYFEAAHALTPQWGGSAEAVEALARQAADRTKDREGQSLYARIYWSVSFYFNMDPVKYGKAQWPRMRQGFDDIIQRYPEPWNLNNYANFACQQGDTATLRRVLALIGDRFDVVAWDPETIARCRDSVK